MGIASKKSTPGLVDSKRAPNPPPDPHPVAWPGGGGSRNPPAVRKYFGATLTRLLRERGIKKSHLAVMLFGRRPDGAPVNNGVLTHWSKGSMPKQEVALWLAEALQVPLSTFVLPGATAPGTAPPAGAVVSATGKRAYVRKSNGHDTAPPVPLPQDAPAPRIEVKTYPDDARFMSVSLTGTFPAEVAMSLMALAAKPHG